VVWAADTPAAAVAGSDAVFTMPANPKALDQVLSGDDGLLGALRPRAGAHRHVHVGPLVIHSVARRLPSDVNLIDAPVRGSVPEATVGRLAIYVGATAADFEKVRPLLAVLGTPHHVGDPGAGAATKLVVNLTLGVAITALGEALTVGQHDRKRRLPRPRPATGLRALAAGLRGGDRRVPRRRGHRRAARRPPGRPAPSLAAHRLHCPGHHPRGGHPARRAWRA
jgi:hypothetical protein